MSLRTYSVKFCQLKQDLSKLTVTNRCSDFEVMPKSRAENLVVLSRNRESFFRKKY